MNGIWSLVFGNPDLGRVDFPTLVRRSQPNDALICLSELCPKASVDREPPVFPVSAARLRAIVSEMARAQPATTILDDRGTQSRYLVRSRLFGFPDTVNVEVFDRGSAHSTIALYSRSQVGRTDFGVNLRRLDRWLKRIEALALNGS
jgi:uncharacterized protein (DUF1499 family)